MISLSKEQQWKQIPLDFTLCPFIPPGTPPFTFFFLHFSYQISLTNILLTADIPPSDKTDEQCSDGATGGQEEDKQEEDCK